MSEEIAAYTAIPPVWVLLEVAERAEQEAAKRPKLVDLFGEETVKVAEGLIKKADVGLSLSTLCGLIELHRNRVIAEPPKVLELRPELPHHYTASVFENPKFNGYMGRRRKR